jgi:glutamate-1-semialdehyde aminotransferase
VKSQWVQLGRKYEIVIDTWGIAALPGFTIVSDKALEYKTLITQEMLQQGILASNSIYVSTEHSDRFLDRYFEALDPIFALIAECQNAGRDVVSLLDGPACHSGFSRLN